VRLLSLQGLDKRIWQVQYFALRHQGGQQVILDHDGRDIPMEARDEIVNAVRTVLSEVPSAPRRALRGSAHVLDGPGNRMAQFRGCMEGPVRFAQHLAR
jgi:hypothetical protein